MSLPGVLWKRLLCAAVIVMACLCMQLSAEEKKGTINVKNETNKTVYIVLDGYNQGEIWTNYSQEYSVSFGEHKVEAWRGDDHASKYISVSASYPDAEWCITNGDF